MQDIEKNMDDLFRKAVDNYRLKPGESNWDKIAPKLLTGPVISPAIKKKNSSKTYILLLLLLLFFITGGILTKYIVHKNPTTVLPNQSKSEINNSAKGPGDFNKETNIAYKKQSEEKEAVSKKDYSLTQYYQQTNCNSLFIKKNNFNIAVVVAINGIKNIQPEVVTLLKDDVNKKASALINQYKSAQVVLNKSVIEEKGTVSDSLTKVAIKLNPTQQHGIYFGAAIGSSFNSVKSQRFRKPGFDIGAIAGYQINKKASVETGLFFGRKYYFTDGKYFSMDKVGSSMPPEMKILSLQGSSTIFEIPAKFRYSILRKNKTTIFSSAGISSYILTNEKNNYLTSMNGTRENIISSYEHSSRYFAAALGLSLTYEYKFRNNKNIRIEPYVQIPLKGIGMGTLPVLTAGLHLGLTVFPQR